MSGRRLSSHKSGLVYNNLRLSGIFCDAVLKVEDAEFQIHRVILCECSPYFRALFKRWSPPEQQVFTIRGLSPAMMQLIIEFAYTGFLPLSRDNVQELLLAADQLNVTDIVQICSDFMGERLRPDNCIGIWQFTNVIFCPELQPKAYRYILDHFEEVVSSEEFQKLSAQELADIINRDDLNVKRESSVYEAILHWITHRPEERKRHMPVLLSKVRLALTSENYIRMTVLSNELVRSNVECLQMVKNALENQDQLFTPICIRNPEARPRLPSAILLAIGGWSGGDPTNGIEAYDIRANLWINVTNNLERPRAYHGTAFLNGYVYCVGGFDRVEHYNSMRRLDLSTHTWHEAAPMYYRRCYVSVTVLNGYIYAMGGYDGHVRLGTAERYWPETNQWSLLPPMHEHRSDASCTTLNNKVYVCGGFNGHECLDTCEYYSPETNQWTVFANMRSRRSGIGVIAYAGHIFAVGGFDGNTRLRSAEAYNPRNNTWHTVASMITTRSNFGIEVLDNLLFAVGGFNGFTTSYNVEYYDVLTNEWTEARDMEIFRSALSCCVVHGLPDMARYAVPRNAPPLPEIDSN